MYYSSPPPPSADDAKNAMPVHSLRLPKNSSRKDEEEEEDEETKSLSSSDSNSVDGFVLELHTLKQDQSSPVVSKRPLDDDEAGVDLGQPPRKR